MKFVEKCLDQELDCSEVGQQVHLTLSTSAQSVAVKEGQVRATIASIDRKCVGDSIIPFTAYNPATCKEVKLKKKVSGYTYCYTFAYDETTELVDPSIEIHSKDICKVGVVNSVDKYILACIEDVVSGDNTSSVSQDITNGDIIHDSGAGTVETLIVTSHDADNIASTGSDGGTKVTCADIVACLPTDTLVDNLDGTYTHTALDGTVVIIDPGTDSLVSNADGTYTHTAVDGTVTIITAHPAQGNSSLVQNDANGIITHTAGDGTISNADVTSADAGNVLTTGSDGGSFLSCAAILACGTDVLVDNLDGTYTHTALDGTVVVIDPGTDSLVANADGSYTHTAVDGTVTILPAPASVVPDLLSQDDTTGVITHTPINGGTATTADVTSADAGNVLTTGSDGGSFLSCAAILACGTDVLVDNLDGTYTHTALDGTVVVIDPGTDSLVANADGSYTHTAVDGTVTILPAPASVLPDLLSQDVTTGVITHTPINGGTATTAVVTSTDVDNIAFTGSDGGTKVTCVEVLDCVNTSVNLTDGTNTEIIDPQDPTNNTVTYAASTNDENGVVLTGVDSPLEVVVGPTDTVTYSIDLTDDAQLVTGTNYLTVVNGGLAVELPCAPLEAFRLVENCCDYLVIRECETQLQVAKVALNKRITVAAHGLGAAGDVVPLAIDPVSGSFFVANTSQFENVAVILGVVVDADTIELSKEACGVNPDPATFTVGAEISILSDGSLGLTSAYPVGTELKQQVGVVLPDGCIQYCLQQAEYCPVAGCCATEFAIDGVTNAVDAALQAALDANLAGTGGCVVVAEDATAVSGWKLAVAEDCNVFIAIPIDADSDGVAEAFTITKNDCKSAPSDLPSSELVVVPQSQVDVDPTLAGSLVDAASLGAGDAQIFVGGTTSGGCFHINVGGKTTVAPDPNADPTLRLQECVTDGTLDLDYGVADTLNKQWDPTLGEVTIVSLANSPCGDYLRKDYDCTGIAVDNYMKQCASPGYIEPELCANIAAQNISPWTDHNEIFYFDDTIAGTKVVVDINAGSFRVKRFAASTFSLTWNLGVPAPTDNGFYKICMSVTANSGVATSDGSFRFRLIQLDGDALTGTNGTEVAVIADITQTGVDTHTVNAPDPSGQVWDRWRFLSLQTGGLNCVDPAQDAYWLFGQADVRDLV